VRLIDADEFLQAMKKADEADPDLATCWSRGSIRRVIEGLPTVDAVEVVRCKDCKNCDFAAGYAYCLLRECGTDENGFCSDGEREVTDNAAD
jgi:hypothetical protein